MEQAAAENLNTRRIMPLSERRSASFDLALALVPVLICGIWTYGAPALREIFLSVFACVFAQWLYRYFMKKPLELSDGTAVATGLLLACLLPPAVPVYVPLLGGAFAQIIVVELFGGYGNQFISPALAARGFLLVSFSTVMSYNAAAQITLKTPLDVMLAGGTVDMAELFICRGVGPIGEISALCILVGFIYLLVRRRADFIVPVVGTAVFAVVLGVFGGHGFDLNYIGTMVLGTGFLFLTCFFASDTHYTPVRPGAKAVFGAVYGALYAIYMMLSNGTDNGTYALMFCMLLTPLMDIFLNGQKKKKITDDAKEED